MDPEPGGRSHKALIGQIVDRYRGDDRIRAIVVFGSVGAGTWHELSDVDLDVVTEDGAEIVPAEEITAVFGPRAVIVLAGPDAADIVLDSAEELSVRWHPLGTTSPNITATARIVAGAISPATLAAAGQASWSAPDEQRLLDTVVRDAVGAYKNLARGRRWEAVTAVERMRRSLTELRGGRDALRLDPAEPGPGPGGRAGRGRGRLGPGRPPAGPAPAGQRPGKPVRPRPAQTRDSSVARAPSLCSESSADW